MESIGTVRNVPTAPREEAGDGGVTTPNSGTPSPASAACTSTTFDNLEDTLKQCEVPMPRAADVPAIKDKLELTITTSAPSTTPGGRIEVQITLRNKTTEPLEVYFKGAPRVELETLDAKGRRVDLPTTRWPGYPKGTKPEPPRDAKVAKLTFDKNGTAHLSASWEAVKTKWAPERARSWEGQGFPRTRGGPLAPGKYSVRVVVPVLGDLDVAKVSVAVGKS